MDDIRRQDRKLLLEELSSPGRLAFLALGIFVVGSVVGWDLSTFLSLFQPQLAVAVFLTIYGVGALRASVRRRFKHKRFEAHWTVVRDRLKLLEEVLKRMQKDQLTTLEELPKNIRRVAQALYAALRRADMIADEVARTERGLYSNAPNWGPAAHDAQARELYKIADKNIAEYKAHFAGVMGGVQRTEAQCAVFMTTVDAVRMKLIGYRLSGRSPELATREFLEAMQEARMQLAAIDQALEEIEQTPWPQTVVVLPNSPTMPPPEVVTVPRNEPVVGSGPPPIPPGAIKSQEEPPENTVRS